MQICRINLRHKPKRKIFTSAFLVWILILIIVKDQASAQYFTLQLATTSGTVACGSNFQTKVLINTVGQQTIAADALIKYDSAKVKVNFDKSVKGDFYTYFSANPLGGSSDKALISSWEESVAREKSSTVDTLMATVDMTPLAPGSTTLSFDCVGTTGADSNINLASDFTDIIKCADNKPLTFTITGTNCGPQPTSTPSATLTPGPTSTPSATPTKKPTSTPVPTNTLVPTVSSLPNVGSTKITLTAVGIGLVLTIVGILFIV